MEESSETDRVLQLQLRAGELKKLEGELRTRHTGLPRDDDGSVIQHSAEAKQWLAEWNEAAREFNKIGQQLPQDVYSGRSFSSTTLVDQLKQWAVDTEYGHRHPNIEGFDEYWANQEAGLRNVDFGKDAVIRDRRMERTQTPTDPTD